MAISIGVNMEFIRHEDKSFAAGVERAAQLGFRYVEPMVHNGRELLSEAGYFHSVSLDDEPLEMKDLLDRYGLQASGPQCALSAHAARNQRAVPAEGDPFRRRHRRAGSQHRRRHPAGLAQPRGCLGRHEVHAHRRAARRRTLRHLHRHRAAPEHFAKPPRACCASRTLVDSPFLKVNYDTGNAFLAGEDPYEGLTGRARPPHSRSRQGHRHHTCRGRTRQSDRNARGLRLRRRRHRLGPRNRHPAQAGFDGVLSCECGTSEQARRSLAHLATAARAVAARPAHV